MSKVCGGTFVPPVGYAKVEADPPWSQEWAEWAFKVFERAVYEEQIYVFAEADGEQS